jgi:CBS domain containing-hemolysin-like protein
MEEMGTAPLIALVLGLALAALVAAADTAFDEANRVRLRELAEQQRMLNGSAKRLLDEPGRTWIALRLLGMLGLVSATAGLVLSFGPSGWGLPMLPLLAGYVLVLVLIIEYLSRILANRHPERIALAVALPIDMMAMVFYPIFDLVGRLTGFRPHANGRSIREDELRALLNMDEDSGSAIQADEIEMMAGIMELGETKVREVMVPRIDIVAIPVDASIEVALDTIIEAGHSRIPVYRDTVDHIIGLLYAKDLLTALRARDFDANIADFLREPRVVPESMLVKTLLGALRSARIHMAIVVDEYGGTAGLVTIEDMIEEIVGEIQDEYDEESPRVEHVSHDEGVFNAGIDIDDVNRMMDIRLPTDAVDTLAGLVLDRLGRVPEPGDRARFEDAEIEVLDLEGRRINRVRVLRRAPEDPSELIESGETTEGDPGEP